VGKVLSSVPLEHEIMVPYLKEHGSSIMSILIHEYSFEDELRVAKEAAEERGVLKGIEKGREEGIEKGIKKGREEERIENARRMKADGVDIALIAKYTNLPKEDIANL
jgi:predicted transposase/invertase (TIGR01784 family)